MAIAPHKPPERPLMATDTKPNEGVLTLMSVLRAELNDGRKFEMAFTRPDRYRHKRTGIFIEIGYMTGEATVRMSKNGRDWQVTRMNDRQAMEFDLYEAIHKCEDA